jgi:hypothetical protein
VLVVVMLLLAGVAVAGGLIRKDSAGRWDLGPWLVLETAAGALASVVAGAVSRRVAGRFSGPVALAACALSFGLIEAIEILRRAGSGAVVAPARLVLAAPLVAAAGVLLGGWRRRSHVDLVKAAARRPLPRRSLLKESLRYAAPVTVLAAAAGVSLFALPGLEAGPRSGIVASALALDFTVVVPGLVFILLVRAGRAPWLVIVPAFVAGYAVAAATMPRQHAGMLETMRLLVVPLEIGLVACLVVLARRGLAVAAGREGDFATRFRWAARTVLASRIPADILTTEVSVLFYAFRWRRRPPLTRGCYTVHREAGYLAVLVGLIMVLAVETIAVHLLVRHWSGAAAWILTGLSLYACVWLAGDLRAMSARPLRITQTHLSMRVGLRWEAEIPLAWIEDAHPLALRGEPPARDGLDASLLGRANVRLRLHRPIEVCGLYGRRKTVGEIRLMVDRAAEFCKELQAARAL